MLNLRKVAVIAQLVEQPPCKRQVVGSSPTCGSINQLTFCLQFYKNMIK